MSEKHVCRGCGHEIDVQTTRCPECGTVLETVTTVSGGEPFEKFVSSLFDAHRDIRTHLDAIGAALKRGGMDNAITTLRELREILDRHVVDEEARILKVLIDAHGREGARDAIRTMQQHRLVHKLVNDMQAKAPASIQEASRLHAELVRILEDHFKAEEDRIFPWALETYAKVGHATHR